MNDDNDKLYEAWAYRDQCSECRTPPGKPHAPDCPAVVSEMAKRFRESTSSVPFSVQEFMFEELVEVQLEYLHDIIKDHERTILAMARDRFRKGFAKYGDRMYHWTPEKRLENVLEELADAVVYSTSGVLE